MEEDIERIKERLLEEVKYSVYPSEKSSIRDRYADTSFLIFKTSQGVHRGSFLSFGSRRSSVVSSYGNTPTFIRRSFSSNGMLEYSVEQTGSSKLKASVNKLPLITKEEKETEETDDDSVQASLVKEVKQKEKDESLEDFHSFKKISDLSKKTPKVVVLPEETEDLELSTKNRKIFSHYDMPLSKNLHSEKDATTSSPKSSSGIVSDNLDNKNIVSDGSDIAPSNTPIDRNCIDETNEKSSMKDPYLNYESHSEVEGNYENVQLPKLVKEPISSNNHGTNIVSNNNPSKTFEQVTLRDSRNSSNNSPSSEKKISLSINEKNDIPFARVADARFSLRDLPLRNPTPPKKSPRRSKKDRVVKGFSDSSTPQRESFHNLSQHFETTTALPPLVSSKSDMQHPDGEVSMLSKLSDMSINGRSLQNLDDTPLFIVEEGDQVDRLPSSSSKLGLHNTTNDNKVKNFIVVRSGDSNSLGLAPISTRNRKLSSSSTASNRSKKSNASNYYSQTVERSSSTSSTKTKMSNYSSSSTTTTTYYSKQTTQIKLLKYKKSSEDESSFVIPPPASNGSNYLITKGRIFSTPQELKDDHVFAELLETNRSRVCSLM